MVMQGPKVDYANRALSLSPGSPTRNTATVNRHGCVIYEYAELERMRQMGSPEWEALVQAALHIDEEDDQRVEGAMAGTSIRQ